MESACCFLYQSRTNTVPDVSSISIANTKDVEIREKSMFFTIFKRLAR